MTDLPNPVYANRTYKIALTIAVMLLAAMITVTVLVIILARARDEDRESRVELTLTAAYADLHLRQTAAVLDTPTPAPAVTPGVYAFEAASPDYLGALSCEAQLVNGQVLNPDGEPRDDLAVMVWGDYLVPQTLATGEIAGLEPGMWSLGLGKVANRRVWVQLISGGRYFSAPVEIVFAAGDCQRNQAHVEFRQVVPLGE